MAFLSQSINYTDLCKISIKQRHLLGNEGSMSCEVKLATLCLKNKGGSDEEMDAVNH
jgi:hypothetical protein